MWITAEAPHSKLINTSKLETIYASYRSYGNWTVCGTIGSVDFVLHRAKTESDANAYIATLKAKLELD